MKKTDIMIYKGYHGSVHFDADEKVLYGKLEFIRDLVTYEAKDAVSLIDEFEKAVDSYLALCKKVNKEPDRPFKGTFNVRLKPDLHKEAYLYGLRSGKNLNNVVVHALEKLFEDDART
jgi:predicted HicB family RNase H-like nuclease